MHRFLFVVLAFLLFASHAHADTGFHLRDHPSVTEAEREAICDAAIPYAQAAAPSGWEIMSATEVINGAGGHCLFGVKHISTNQTYSNQGFVCGASAVCFYDAYTCTAGDTSEVSFPIGRELRSEGDTSFQSFGNVAPSTLCVAGCQGAKSSSQGSDLFGLPDPQSELHDLIYANVSYDLDGTACATADNPPDFEIPPPGSEQPDPCAADPTAPGCTDPTDPTDPTNPTDPTDPTDPGGGDTGGGDTGGGDTGGGDTGGGDTGGDTGGDSGADTGSVAGLPCDATLACSGDAIQCAMLQTQKEQKCLSASALDWPDQKADVESYVAAQSEGSEFDEGDGDVDVSGLFGDAINTRFFPSTCPPAESVSLNTAGGRTFEFTYEPLCQLASDFSYLIVLAASIFFAVYVGRSMGGE